MSLGTLRQSIEQYLNAEMYLEQCRAHAKELGKPASLLHAASETMHEQAASATTPEAEDLARAAKRYAAATSVSAGAGMNMNEMSAAGRELREQMRLAAARLPAPNGVGNGRSGIHKLLVAVDESRQSQWALQFAAELALPLSARVIVMHALEPLTGFEYAAAYEIADTLPVRRRDGEKLLHRARAALPSSLSSEVVLYEGDPAYKIVQAAVASGADLIVMGTHARSRWAELFVGSTAHSVIRHAPCPVLTVGHPLTLLTTEQEAQAPEAVPVAQL